MCGARMCSLVEHYRASLKRTQFGGCQLIGGKAREPFNESSNSDTTANLLGPMHKSIVYVWGGIKVYYFCIILHVLLRYTTVCIVIMLQLIGSGCIDINKE